MRKLAPALICLLAIGTALPGCGDCPRCEKEQDRVRTQLGTPDETESRRDGHLVTETWFYWESERSVVFLWDERECSCGVSEYDFSEGAATATLHFETANRIHHQPLGPE